jgi:enoyl-CoA hydratase/carnithine racemase
MVPWCKAAELLLTGRSIDAQEAYRIGLVNEVVPPEEVMPRARYWASVLSQAAPLAVRTAKECMIRGMDLTLKEGLELEDSLESRLVLTEDFIEGTTAFTERRKPVYKGK